MLLISKHACAAILATVALAPTAAAADKLEFDVASVKPNKSGDPASSANNPLGPGSVWNPTGGFFQAINLPLFQYISFAYKLVGNQDPALRSQMPAWVLDEHYDIQARSNPNATKDETRLMMRALLADRFKLAIHTEARQVPVLAVMLLKPGKFGPWLQPHPKGSCQTDPPPPPTAMVGPFPALCGGLLVLPSSAPGLHGYGGRDVTMQFIASQLASMGRSDRPAVDGTGLSGTFDFALQWVDDPGAAEAAGADVPAGSTFLEAIKEQLGIKLESQKGSVDVLILDHVERLSEN